MVSTDNPPTDTFLGTLVSEWHYEITYLKNMGTRKFVKGS
jgi:hypothetical protein